MKDLGEKIAKTLKALRKERGWSLDFAAKTTGVSKAMLGQIERGESMPTIATLWKIASGFETSFSSFIDEPLDATLGPVHRAGHLESLHPNETGIRISPLFPFDAELLFEVFLIELLPSAEHISPPHERGVIEHVIAIEGEMEVLVGGDWHKVQKNEGLRFNAHQPHGYRNRSCGVTVFHDIIHYARSTR